MRSHYNLANAYDVPIYACNPNWVFHASCACLFHPQAKELYIPGVFITARAGERLSAAAATTNTHGDRKRETGYQPSHLTVTFHPNNTVARAWVGLGTITWPTDLLETRVLERQLKASEYLGHSYHVYSEHVRGGKRIPSYHMCMMSRDSSGFGTNHVRWTAASPGGSSKEGRL